MPERPILTRGDAVEEEAEKYALLTLGSGAFGKWPGKPPGHEKDKQLSVLSEAPALPALLVEGDACQGGMIDNHNHQEPGEVNHGIMEEEAERNAPLTLGSGAFGKWPGKPTGIGDLMAPYVVQAQDGTHVAKDDPNHTGMPWSQQRMIHLKTQHKRKGCLVAKCQNCEESLSAG